jgi:hypothetical protein
MAIALRRCPGELQIQRVARPCNQRLCALTYMNTSSGQNLSDALMAT